MRSTLALPLLRLFIPLTAAVVLSACGSGQVEGPTDTLAPSVVSIAPSDGAVDVARDAVVSVVFSEDVTAEGSILLTLQGATAPVPTSFSYDASTFTATLTPSATLEPFATYTVAVSGTVKDLAGNGITGTGTSSFTTVDDVPPGVPGTPTDPGLYSTTTAITFQWAAASDEGSGVAGYALEISSGSPGNVAATISLTDASASSHTYTGTQGVLYFARVRAVDAAGNAGTFSASSDGIRIDTTAPATPAAPTVEGSFDDATVHFAWAATSDPESTVVGQVLEVATSQSTTDIVATIPLSAGALAHDFDATLYDGDTLYARVTASNGAGLSSSPSAWSSGVTVDATAPATPAAPTVAGPYSSATSVTFSWTAPTESGSGIASYTVTASDGTGGTNTVVTGVTGTSYTVTGGVSGRTYTVAVRAVDAVGNASSDSAWSQGVTVDTTAPTSPSTPTHVGAFDDATVTFSIGGASDPESGVTGYRVQIATASDGTGVVFDQVVATASATYPTGASGTTYYARAAARNGAGLEGAFSSFSSGVLVDTTAAADPTTSTVGPYDNASVSFTWTSSSDAQSGITGYILDVSTQSGAAGIIATQNLSAATLSYDFNAAGRDGQTLYARVRAVNGAGLSSSGTSWSSGVIVDTQGPPAPAAPTDTGAYAAATSLTFFMTPTTDSGSGVASYELQIRDGATNQILHTEPGLSASSFTYTGLPNVLHVAHVRAVDLVGNVGPFSVASNGIVVDTSAPTAPNAPGHAGSYDDTTLTFSLSGGSDAQSGVESYRVQITTATDGSGIVQSATVPASSGSFDFTGGQQGVTYYARVAAVNGAGTRGDYSTFSTAVTVDLTAPIISGRPADVGDFDNASVSFSWPAGSDPQSTVVSYTLAIAVSPDLADVVHTEVLSGTSFVFPATAHAGETLFAAVYATNGRGLASDFSPWSNGVFVDTVAPVMPSAPSTGGPESGAQLVFSWAPAVETGSGVDFYTIDIIEVGSSATVHSANTAATSYGGFSGTNGLSYRARVKATDQVENVGAFSADSAQVLVDTTRPGVPQTPDDGGDYSSSGVLLLSWAAPAAGPAPTAYSVQVGSSVGGSQFCTFDTGNTGLSLAYNVATPPGACATIADGTTVFFRVAAKNGASLGSYSESSDGVIVDTSPPSAPGLPLHGQLYDDASIVWSFASSSDVHTSVSGYSYEISLSSTCAGSVSTGSTTGTSIEFAAPSTSGVTYYARVRATNGAGLQSAFSACSAGVTVDLTPPSQVYAPIDLGPYDNASVHFTWTAAQDSDSGISQYFLYIATSPDPADIVHTEVLGGGELNFDFDGTLYGTQTLFAALEAENGRGLRSAMTTWSDGVTVDLVAPPTPAAPLTSGAEQALMVSFVWNPVTDAGSGTAGYDIQIFENAGVTPFFSDFVNNTQYTFFGGSSGNTYYAKVRGIDIASNIGSYSPASAGVVRNDSLQAAPGPVYDNGVGSSVATQAFSWSPPGGVPPAYYRISVGSSLGASNLCEKDLGSDAFFTYEDPASAPCTTIADGTTVYVRAAAMPSGGGALSAWSPSSDGILIDRTAPPAPSAPTAAVTAPQTVSFSWAPAPDPHSGVATYLLELAIPGCWAPTFLTSETSYDWTPDPCADGKEITARLQVQNRVGTWGPFSPWSTPLEVDAQRPRLWWAWPNDGSRIGPANDFIAAFTEPMDRDTVEAAFSLVDAATLAPPAFGLAFYWNTASTQVYVQPDSVSPAGITNSDILAPNREFILTISTAARDLAGNAMDGNQSTPELDDFVSVFTTASLAQPQLLAARVAGGADVLNALADAADLGSSATLDLQFDQAMWHGSARAQLYGPAFNQYFELRSVQVNSAVGLGAGRARFETDGPHDFPNGALVEVAGMSPPGLNTDGAQAITVVDSDTFEADCLEDTTETSYSWGTAVRHGTSEPDGSSIAWVDATTLRLTLPSSAQLMANTEYRVFAWDVGNADRMWANPSFTLQVAGDGSDTSAPVFAGSLPVDGQSDASGLAPIVLFFSEPMARSRLGAIEVSGTGVSSDDFELYSGDGNEEGGGGPDTSDTMVILTPRRPMQPGGAITVDLPATLEDLSGNPLDGGAQSVSFLVSADVDGAAPVVTDTSPPSSLPAAPVLAIRDAWEIQVQLADAATGRLDLLSVDSVPSDAIFVFNERLGLPMRGLSAEVRPGFGVLRVRAAPYTNGMSTASVFGGLASAVSNGTTVTYQASEPHDLALGDVVSVYGMEEPGPSSTPDPRFNTVEALVLSVPSATTFVLAPPSPAPAATSAEYGGYNAQLGTNFTLSLGRYAPLVDAYGNPLDWESSERVFALRPTDQAQTQNMTPYQSELQQSLRTSTSLVGRSLTLDVRVRDSNGDTVHVSLDGAGLADDQVSGDVATNPWGDGYLRYPSGGDGPMAPPEPGMTDTNYPTSDYYAFSLTLNDGQAAANSVTTYDQVVWVWSPADAPEPVSVGGVAVGGTLLVTDATPTFAWSTSALAAAEADITQLIAADLSALYSDGGGGGAYFQGHFLAPGTESFTPTVSQMLPRAGVYLWAVSHQKSWPPYAGEDSQAWGIDWPAGFADSLFVFGPSNSRLAGTSYGVAQAGFVVSQSQSGLEYVGLPSATSTSPRTAPWHYGLYTFASDGITLDYDRDAAPPHTFVAHNGTSPPATAPSFLYGYDEATQTVALTHASEMGLPYVNNGVAGVPLAIGGGQTRPALFATVSGAPDELELRVGAHRFKTSAFASTELTGDWAFVRVDLTQEGPNALSSFSTSYGVAQADGAAGTLDFATWATQAGRAVGAPPITNATFTLAGDGLLSVDLGGAVTAKGYVGGAADASFVALSSSNSNNNATWLFMMRREDLSSSDDSDLSGDYGVVELLVHTSGGNLGMAAAVSGTVSFDGVGGLSYDVLGSFGRSQGTEIYTVDSGDERIVISSSDGHPIELLAHGAGFPVIAGISVADPDAPNYDPDFALVVIGMKR